MTDKSLPRVTEILKACGMLPDLKFVPEWALVRGTATHEYLEVHDKGILDESDVDPVIVPRLAGWKKFLADSRVEILGIEESVENEALRYRGRLDRRIRLNGKLGVLDIKNGSPFPWHAIQTAAYRMCLPPDYIGRWSLYLDGEGDYRLIEHTNRQDERVWTSCLNLFHWRVSHKIESAFEAAIEEGATV